MGKKSKQKKLRSQKHSPQVTSVRPQSSKNSSALGDALFSESPSMSQATRTVNGKSVTLQDYGYVRGEIQRILLYLLLIVSLLAAAVIVNSRTTWLNTAGSEAARLIGLR